MTYAPTVVSDWASAEPLDDAAMARKPALPPEDDEDAELTAELRLAFGSNVKAARIKANMTQTELADRAGLRQHHVSQIENGQINVTLGTMARLARVFGEDLATMLRKASGSGE